MADQTVLYLLKGLEENLPTEIISGRVYYCTDTSNLYVDSEGSDGIPVREQINANKAQYLKSLESLTAPGYHELYIDKDIISLGRKDGESQYEAGRDSAGKYSVAIGNNTSATGDSSSALGDNVTALNIGSHAIGVNTLAEGIGSSAEGYDTVAKGDYSHAGGSNSKAEGTNSFAQGFGVLSKSDNSVAFGRFNNVGNTTAFSVGNGTSDDDRSNAFIIDWQGNAEFSGQVKVAEPIYESDAATKEYVDKKSPVLVLETKRIEADDTQSVTFENIDNIQPYLVFYNGLLMVQDEHYILELPNTIVFNGWVANENDLITISGKQFTDVNEGKAFEASRLSNKNPVGGKTHPVYFSEYGIPVPCGDELDVKISRNAATATLAETAKKLDNTIEIGSIEKPVYFNDKGIPAPCGNYLNINVASADKLTTAETGSLTKPIFFNAQGIPEACGESLGVNITGNAKTATTADKLSCGLVGTNEHPIYINADGIPQPCSETLDVNIKRKAASAFQADEATIAYTAHKLANTSQIGTKEKPVFFTADGIPWECDPKLAVSITGDCDGSSGSCTGNAATADRLKDGKMVGSTDHPIYFENGIPKKCAESLVIDITGSSGSCTGTAQKAEMLTVNGGSDSAPIYFENGIPQKCAGPLIIDIDGSSTSCSGNAKSADTATQAGKLMNTKDIGSDTLPVYFTAAGIPHECGPSLGVDITGNAESANRLGTNAGSENTPIYFADGIPKKCGNTLDVNIDGTAENAKYIRVAGVDNTNSKLFVLGATTTGYTEACIKSSVYMENNVLYGAAWNDYAEYRQSDVFEAGRVVCENGDDTLSLAVERLQPGAEIVSDTFGFAIGQTETCKTPIAVSGRVLAYPYEDRNTYKPGDAVCAAPGGTVSKMTREEIREYPERIVGTVSAVPAYETWGENNIAVNGRIWIKVK